MWTGFTPPWSRVGLVLQYLQDRPTPFGEIFKIKRIGTPLPPRPCHLLWHNVTGYFVTSMSQVLVTSLWFHSAREAVTQCQTQCHNSAYIDMIQAQLWHITNVNLWYRAELWHTTGVRQCHKYKAELWHITGLDCDKMSQDGSVTYVTCQVLFFRTACDITSRFIGQTGTCHRSGRHLWHHITWLSCDTTPFLW